MPTSQQLAVQLQADLKAAQQRAQSQANQIKVLLKQVSDLQAQNATLAVNAVDPGLMQQLLDAAALIAPEVVP